MHLKINDSFYISDIAQGDQPAYIEHLKEKQIYDQTLAIPYPYTQADADWWVNHNLEATQKQSGRSVNWALRRSEDSFLVGGIGFLGLEIGDHVSELGYWLAKPYWGKGLMTEAVQKVVEFAFKEFSLVRITANVFHFNIGSARVLEKAGFQCEAYLKKHYKKDGHIFDGKLYAMINPEFSKVLAHDNKQRTFSGAPWESKVGYCRAIRAGKTIAVTGTAPVTDEGKVFAVGAPYAQAKRCLEIIERAILPLGASRKDIVRTRLFVTDISQWQDIGRAHGEFFKDFPPATTMVEVKSLIDPDMLVEIEADAILTDT